MQVSPTAELAPGHAVQFYESEDFLLDVVADFAPEVLIATPAHRDGLAARGADFSRIVFADAQQTLASFMDDGRPDAQRFRAAIGALIPKTRNRPLRAFGEMVDILWRDGNSAAALQLEELWNQLAAEEQIELLCGYGLGGFGSESGAFDAVCDRHAEVQPAETFGGGLDPRAIARLQQRAAALEVEVRERRKLEETCAFLLDVTTALNRSLDFDSRVDELLSRIVPRLAAWCAVDVVDEDGKTTRAGSAGTSTDTVTVIPLTLGERTVGALHLDRCNDMSLANDVAQRAAIALENARLHRMTEEANRAKDEFLATLSHELRTPLTAVLGWAHMLSLGGLDAATMRTAIETIERSARMQAVLIDDLLDLSEVVTGKLSLQNDVVELGEVVQNAVETLRLAADAKQIDVEVAAGERAIVNGDATRLQQIAWNLLSNAIKFSPPASSVSVAVERMNGSAKIVVRDTGRGIAPNFLPHVFQPFRQADGTDNRANGGLGLGLAIVKYLTELHGGTVTASSDGEGRGATFTVTMPLAIR